MKPTKPTKRNAKNSKFQDSSKPGDRKRTLKSSSRTTTERTAEAAKRRLEKATPGADSSSRKRSTTRTSSKPKQTAPKKGQYKAAAEATHLPVRLNKVIADAGVASRRHADEYIAAGRVRVNGVVAHELGMKVTLDDMVTVDGEPVTRSKHLTYVILNKPKGVITTSSDEKGRSTVFDIVKIQLRLFTVGRLDRNTTGVLLLTNDGELANRLMHPRYGIPRAYKAVVDKMFRTEDARKLAGGLELEDGPTQPCLVVINPEDKKEVMLEIREGRNREVRRMFEHLGYEVQRLDRKQYAFLSTRGLKRGEYRHLTRDEVFELRRLVKLDA